MGERFELRADRAKLLKAATVAASVVSRRSTAPILGFLKIEAGPERAVLTGTDLDREMRVEVEAEGSGSTCLPAVRLRDTLKAMSNAEAVTFAGDDKGNVKLLSEGTEVSFLPLPVADYPTIGVGAEAWRIALPNGVAAFLIGGAATVMSTEETRYYLNGVCLEIKENIVHVTATDGHRLVSRSTKLDGDLPEVGPTIIHRDAVKSLLCLAGRDEVTLAAHVGAGKNSTTVIDVVVPGARLRSKLIDGIYPDWRRVVPTEEGIVVEVVVSDLRRAMAVASATNDQRGRAVRLAKSGHHLMVSCSNPDSGSAVCKLPCGEDVELPDFGVNAVYLDGMAKSMEVLGSRTMRLAVTTPGSPVRIMPDPAITGTLSVLMPMRV